MDSYSCLRVPVVGLCFLFLSLSNAENKAEPAGPALYSQVVSGEPDLVAYWPFDGDISPVKGEFQGKAVGGTCEFCEGPAGGKAIEFSNGRFLTFNDVEKLDLRESSVELWLRPEFEPPAPYNPCIIARRDSGDHTRTRFSLHIWNDYSCFAVWNGSAVTKYALKEIPLRKDTWYHLVLTCTSGSMKLFVNGLPCDSTPGRGGFDPQKKGLPLSIASSTPGGRELLECTVDEVAFYRETLSADRIAGHVDAMGWGNKRRELASKLEERLKLERIAKKRAERKRRRDRERVFSDPELLERGEQKVYTGKHLEAISFSVGGIGTGLVQLDGQGRVHAWQIFNNHRCVEIPHSFFAVRMEENGCEAAAGAVQGNAAGPFDGFKKTCFRGEYPFGWYTFADRKMPAEVTMEVFNPLVPLDLRNSSIPCAVFNLSVENTTDNPLRVNFLAAQQNAVGYLGKGRIKGRTHERYGENVNRVIRTSKATLIHMTSEKDKQDPGFGDMVLMALTSKASATASWEDMGKLYEEFRKSGTVSGPQQAGPSEPGRSLDGAIAVNLTIAPGKERAVPFVLTWSFPNARHGQGAWGGKGNMYTNWWPDSLSSAHYLEARLGELTAGTRLYHDTLYASNLPRWLLDRISSQVVALRSRTCFWTKEGYFGGWEGCRRDNGCCYGNCNHVWHYAQAHARLFPEIAKRMREQEFHFQAETGAIPHRQPSSFPAFDGQCGAVLNSYREHLMSPDEDWLEDNWKHIKAAMDYIVRRWDEDEDGVPSGAQWNTLDGALGGSSSWLGSLYLASLRAAGNMASLVNETGAAKRYREICASGMKLQNESLFNGEYYVQIPGSKPREDYGPGCHIDQVLGQWWAHQLNLGWIYPRKRVRSALRSLVKYNFRGNFHMLKQSPRKFVADDDPGLQMITWPQGGKPSKVIRYAGEVMTGFEYAAGAAMVQAGLLREGFAVVRAVSMRYDGRLRSGLTDAAWGYSGNPFGDDECGKFYARAMSVWSMLLASQGFVYDGPSGKIGFKPVWKPEDHVSMFTAAEGWGRFIQKRSKGKQLERLVVNRGRLRVGELVFQVAEGAKPDAVKVSLGGETVKNSFACSGREVTVRLEDPVVVKPQTGLQCELSIRSQEG